MNSADKTLGPLPSPEEQKVAGLAQMLGIIAALPVWISWHDRSAFVRLHAIQSMLLDVVLLVVVAGSLTMLAGGLMGGVALADRPDVSMLALAVVMFGLPLCGLAILMLALTGLLLLRLRAAMAALQGRDYRYPLLGRWG